MSRIDELNQEIVNFKARAYDILANQEALTKDFQAKNQELQRQLTETNNQIRRRFEELDTLSKELGPEADGDPKPIEVL